MKKEYLTIHNSILPDYYDKILQATKRVEDEHVSVSQVCKELDISRSTYYKYKDKIYYSDKPEIISTYQLVLKNYENAFLNLILHIVNNKGFIKSINQTIIDDKIIVLVVVSYKDITNIDLLENYAFKDSVIDCVKII